MYLGKTYFSLKYGTYSTKELVKDAVDAGAATLGLTNINVTCDAWDFVQYCRRKRIFRRNRRVSFLIRLYQSIDSIKKQFGEGLVMRAGGVRGHAKGPRT